MSWLLKDATVLSSAVVVPREKHLAPWSQVRTMTADQSIVMMNRHIAHSFFARSPVVVAICDREMVVVAMRSLSPNRFGGFALRSEAIVIVPTRLVSHFDLHVGDKLEIRL